uniref:Sugar transporter SWEET n=1 Tax=Lygus hesperus TaxID=30085 RepID=A0A0A9ZH84_LYGHE
MNFSPVFTIRVIDLAGTVGDSTITFYGAQMYSGVTWACYGAYSWSFPLLISNTLGNTVSTYCMLTYLTVVRREEKVKGKHSTNTYTRSLITALFFVMLSLTHLVVTIFLIMNNKTNFAKMMTGYESSIASIVMLSSPLMMFKRIIETKNAQSLAPLTIFFAFFNTLFWVIAGFMIKDIFIIFPNLVCFIACCCQYILLFRYGRGGSAKTIIHQAIASVPFD